MESLQLSNFTLNENRCDYYYGKFRYKVSIEFTGFHYFRYCKNDVEVQRALTNKIKTGYLIMGPPKTVLSIVGEEMIEPIKATVRFIKSLPKDEAKAVISYNSLTLYSNDIEDIENIIRCSGHDHTSVKYEYTNKLLNFERGVIYHVNPKFKFRLYITSKIWAYDDKESLQQYFSSNDDISPSPSFSLWLQGYRQLRHTPWSQNTYFIDYNDSSHVSYLALRYGDIIRKVCDIKQR
jgi:hypothetical protein